MATEPDTKLLLVCDNEAYIRNIKTRLERSITVRCYVWHCLTLLEGLNYLDHKDLRADIVLLDLGLIGTDNPKTIYEKMGKAAHGIPIIALTGRSQEEHDLAIFVMEAGAADHMIRGDFSRITDVLEFSLIRHKIANKFMQDAVNKLYPDQKIIQDAKIKSDEENEIKNQYIAWMTGGYSVENNLVRGK
jgi:DNA-binding response OmpR family regulator